MSNFYDALRPDHQEYVELLRKEFKVFENNFSDLEVEAIWKAFSKAMQAEYLVVTKESLDKFREWIKN